MSEKYAEAAQHLKREQEPAVRELHHWPEIYHTANGYKVQCECGWNSKSIKGIDPDEGLKVMWKEHVASAAQPPQELVSLREALIARDALDRGLPTPWGHDCEWCGACVERVYELKRVALALTRGAVGRAAQEPK